MFLKQIFNNALLFSIFSNICTYIISYIYIRFNNWIIQGSILKSENRISFCYEVIKNTKIKNNQYASITINNDNYLNGK